MIYDKNQFSFNIVFLVLLIGLLVLFLIQGANLRNQLTDIQSNLSRIEANQNFNFIQGSHNKVEHLLTTQGMTVTTANDYGLFNGPSMQPSIFDGNTLIENKYDGSLLSDGQIIRYVREDGNPVVHRVRADYGDRVFVQGDALKEGEIISKDKITHMIVGVLFT